jgi:hypothetical protein
LRLRQLPGRRKSVNRDTYEITGAGTFNPQKQVRKRCRHFYPQKPMAGNRNRCLDFESTISFDVAALRLMRFGNEASLREFGLPPQSSPMSVSPVLSAAWRYSISACCLLRECQVLTAVLQVNCWQTRHAIAG